MTRERTIGTLAVVGIVLLALLFFTPGKGETVEVAFSSQGFSPRVTSIREGDSVVFKNVGTSTHWIASDVHPTHSLYPGSDVRKCGKAEASLMFDSCRGIGPSETYRFRFHKAGEWGMHDHLDPRLTGVIRVSAVSGYARSFVDLVDMFRIDVIERWSDFSAFVFPKNYERVDVASVLENDREVRRMIQALGLTRTVEKVAYEVSYEHAASECHAAMHIVGNQAYELLGAHAFGECTADCFSGCYHGVIERMSSYGGKGVFDEVRSVCGERTTVFDRDQCFHGAGHGFLTNVRYDLMQAINACRELGEGDTRYWCYGGVFMEALEGDPRAKGGDTIRSYTNLHYPCDIFGTDEEAERACYRLWPSHFLSVHGDDYEKASAECLQAPERSRDVCFLRLGQIAGAHTDDPAKKTESFCASVPGEYYDACIEGGLRQAIVFPGPDPDGGPVSFCRSLSSLPAKNACYSEYARNLRDMFLDSDTRLRICSLFEPPYDASCRSVQ